MKTIYNKILKERGQPLLCKQLKDTIINFNNHIKHFYDDMTEDEIYNDRRSAFIHTSENDFNINQEYVNEKLKIILDNTKYNKIEKYAMYVSGTENTIIIQGIGVYNNNYNDELKEQFTLLIQKPYDYFWGVEHNMGTCTRVLIN